MQKIKGFLIVLSLFVFANNAVAQNSNTEEKIKEIISNMWIGTGLDGVSIGGSQFLVGLSPIIGYKLTETTSAGIRIPFDYNYYKLTGTNGDVINYSDLDLGIGGFVRQKLIFGVFAHAEYNTLRIVDPAIENGFFQVDPNDPNTILQNRYNDRQFNVGLGFSREARIGYEISLLYDVLEPSSSPTIPFVFRVGFNYNF